METISTTHESRRSPLPDSAQDTPIIASSPHVQAINALLNADAEKAECPCGPRGTAAWDWWTGGPLELLAEH